MCTDPPALDEPEPLRISTSPPVDPIPANTLTAPPLLATSDDTSPARTTTIAPSDDLLLPADTDTDPASPDALSPLNNFTLPEEAEPDPLDTDTDPLGTSDTLIDEPTK